MPTHDFSDIGDVLNFDILNGKIVTIDPAMDTCTVSIGGDTLTALLFYHCSPDSVLRDNGSIEGAASGFAIDDEVIVLINKGKSVIKVIGHTDGARHCGGLAVYVFYDENKKMARGRIVGGSFVVEKIYNTADYNMSINDGAIKCHAKKINLQVLQPDNSYLNKTFYLIGWSFRLIGDTFDSGIEYESGAIYWYLCDPSRSKFVYIDSGEMPFSSFPKDDPAIGGGRRYAYPGPPQGYYPIHLPETNCCFNVSTDCLRLFYSKDSTVRAYTIKETLQKQYELIISTEATVESFVAAGTGVFDFDGQTMSNVSIWFIDRAGTVYQLSERIYGEGYLSYSWNIDSPSEMTCLGGYFAGEGNGTTTSIINAEIYSPDGYYAKQDNTITKTAHYESITLPNTQTLSAIMTHTGQFTGSTYEYNIEPDPFLPPKACHNISDEYSVEYYTGALLSKTADGAFSESVSRTITWIITPESYPVNDPPYADKLAVSIKCNGESFDSFDASPANHEASRDLVVTPKRPEPWFHIQDDDNFLRGVLIADHGESVYAVKRAYNDTASIGNAIASTLGVSLDTINGLIYAPQI